jgi:hypothetical protein
MPYLYNKNESGIAAAKIPSTIIVPSLPSILQKLDGVFIPILECDVAIAYRPFE